MTTFLSRTNTKRFTFTAYGQSVDTSDFADASPYYSALAPVWSNNAPYDMGASLPTTVGAKVAYILSDLP
ncbi:hypothetical protein [Chelatococcus asaccharovorans]|uniref:hypothetical protein n=1 Tax=Chelatococcus asaccharovorans TaxID=28210 RepID=UPI002263AFB3|nr:hypothetical protein [Chelatococcus asaccharovorans]